MLQFKRFARFRFLSLPAIAILAAACSETASPALKSADSTGPDQALWWRSNVAKVVVELKASTIAPSQTTTATATAQDANGQPVTGKSLWWYSADSKIAKVSSAGVVTGVALGSTAIKVLVDGVVGSASITVGSAPTTPPAGAATKLGIQRQPGGAVSGLNLAVQPIIDIRNAADGVASTSTASVTAAIASGSGTLRGTTTVAAVNGVATFTNLRIDGAGAHTIRFTSSGLAEAVSAGITATQTAASLGIQTQPGGATSGASLAPQPVVRILDNAGILIANSTLAVTAARSAGTGALSGTTTVNAVNGVATFTNLKITGSGSHSLTFSTASPALSVASATFNIGTTTTPAPGGGVELRIGATPSSVTSGSPLALLLGVATAENTLASTSTAAVTAAIASGSGVTLSGTTTVNAVGGAINFTNLILTGAGQVTLVFTSPGLKSVTSTPITVLSGTVTPPPVVTPPPTTPPPTGTAKANIYWHDFNDGTLGPYTANVPVGTNLTVPNDPTGSGRGRVFSIRYQDPGPMADINRYLTPVPPTSVTYGSTLWFSGEVYFPTNTPNFASSGVQRKLLYFRNDDPAYPQFTVTFRTFGNRPTLEWTHRGSVVGSVSTDFAGVALQMGQWYKIEMEIKMCSSAGGTDGAIRIYINGTLAQQYLNYCPTAAGDTRPLRFNRWWVGAQREGTTGEMAVDETRYWDNVGFGTQRISP